MIAAFHAQVGRQRSIEDSFHEGLVVLLGDFLVRNPDVTVHDFRVGFMLGHEVGSIDGLLALRNGILVNGVVQFTLLHRDQGVMGAIGAAHGDLANLPGGR
jgi:hypothetical protein